MLAGAALVLVATTVLAILGISGREALKSLSRRHRHSRRVKCARELVGIEQLERGQIEDFVTRLKRSFRPDTLANCIAKLAPESEPKVRELLAEVASASGVVDVDIGNLRSAKRWRARADAAERLGRIGNTRALPELLTAAADADEDPHVRRLSIRALACFGDPRAIQPLIDLLVDDTVTAFYSVIADALESHSTAAQPMLIAKLLRSESAEQRFWIARILGRRSSPESVEALVGSLSDRSPKVRGEAAVSLGKLEARSAVDALIDLVLRDPVSLVREDAARALAAIGDAGALDALTAAVSQLPAAVRYDALTAIEKMGEPVVPLLLEALEDGEPRTRKFAAAALQRTGHIDRLVGRLATEPGRSAGGAYDTLELIVATGAIESVVRALSHEDFRVRYRICELLAGASRAKDRLMELANSDSEWCVRAAATTGLLRIGDDRAIAHLAKSLGEEEEAFRESVLESLVQAPPSMIDSVLDTLLGLLEDSNTRVRALAVRTLGRAASANVVDALLGSLHDSAIEVRCAAAEQLASWPGDRVREALETALQDRSPEGRESVAGALAKIGNSASVPVLLDALEHIENPDDSEITKALAALSNDGFDALADRMMSLDSPRARAGIANVLGVCADAGAAPLLRTFLIDADPAVRSQATVALGRCGSPAVGQALFHLLNDPEEDVRVAALSALGSMKEAGVEWATEIPWMLEPLLEDPSPRVQAAAALGLGRIGDPATILSLRRLYADNDDDDCRAAAVVGLALLEDSESLREVLEAVKDHKLGPLIRQLLADEGAEETEGFLAFTALGPEMLSDRSAGGGDLGDHFATLLQGNAVASVRARAARALGYLVAVEHVEVLRRALHTDPDPEVRAAAVTSLRDLVDPADAMPQLLKALGDQTKSVRAAAGAALASLDPESAAPYREALVNIVVANPEESEEAALNLCVACHKNDWQPLVDRLVGAEDKSEIVGLLQIVGRIAHPATGQILFRFLEHRDRDIRVAASQVPPEVFATLPVTDLTPYLTDPSDAVRVMAVRCLATRISASVFGMLLQRLLDPSATVRHQVAKALGMAHFLDDTRLVTALAILAYRDESVVVRGAALVSLVRLGATDLEDIFAQALGAPCPADAHALRAHLQQAGIPERLMQTIRADPAPERRAQAVRILGILNTDRHVQDILAALNDPESTVRLSALHTLRKHPSAAVQQRLRSLSTDPVEQVRLAVSGYVAPSQMAS